MKHDSQVRGSRRVGEEEEWPATGENSPRTHTCGGKWGPLKGDQLSPGRTRKARREGDGKVDVLDSHLDSGSYSSYHDLVRPAGGLHVFH